MKQIVVFFLIGSTLFAESLSLVNYDPFAKAKEIIIDKNYNHHRVKKRTSLQLVAILNNRAYINGHFYTIGDSISKYRIIKIANDAVWLKRGKKIKQIRLKYKHIVKIRSKEKVEK
jgi:uncharacterized Zn ribbon protein